MRTHEKALANALQLRRQGPKPKATNSNAGDSSPTQISHYQPTTASSSSSNALAAALSLGKLSFTSQSIKPAKLTLTPHHLFYLLSRFEEHAIPVGSMNVRLENIHAEASPANYVSFLSQSQRTKGRSDRDSIHSVSSVRSVMSGMTGLWSSFGLGSSHSGAKTDKAKAQLVADIKYLYSAFTKIPCLRLSPDSRARLIRGYEEFPFDTAVPLICFKNVSALEVSDVDFRQFFGWDRLADQLRSLTIKRGHVEDPADLLVNIVLDDMDKRRRRSSKTRSSLTFARPSSPLLRQSDNVRANSVPGTPTIDDSLGSSASPRNSLFFQADTDTPSTPQRSRTKSTSPTRPTSSRQGSSYRHVRASTKVKRSGSSSSNSSNHSNGALRTRSSSNLLSMGFLPASKWRFLKHLSLADNSMTSLTATGLAPLANTLQSLDLSSNLFTEIPDCLATLTALRALNLSNCMIESLHSLSRNPLPAITALNLRSNRLASIAGIERLLSLERLDLRSNRLSDPTELARLTGIPDIQEIWVLSNPFVKTHGSYRITIFNLFRNTPGYADDVVIDATGPGYNERRQLKDRATEAEGVPVVRPAPEEQNLSLQSMISEAKPAISHQLEAAGLKKSLTNAPQRTQSEYGSTSARRRKAVRRRIVDLSVDEYQQPETPTRRSHVAFVEPQKTLMTSEFGVPPRHVPGIEPSISYNATVPLPQHPQFARSVPPPLITQPDVLQEAGASISHTIPSTNLDGSAYRRKVEALREEFGNGWLNVLGEEGWDGHRRAEAPMASSDFGRGPRPELSSLRATSQGILGGSRTLG